MDKIVNGMPASDIRHAEWRKSSWSGAQGNCVEVAPLPTGAIGVRNSRDPNGPALIFTHDEMAAFVAGAKAGEFDRPDDPDLDLDPEPAHAPTLAPPQPAFADQNRGTPSRYQAINNEVQKLTGRLLEGDTMLDRESSERLLRVLSGVALLQQIHRVDRNGHCTICRTKSRRWHPASRHDVCSVYAALNLYLGRSLVASEANPATDSFWRKVGSPRRPR